MYQSASNKIHFGTLSQRFIEYGTNQFKTSLKYNYISYDTKVDQN